MEIETIYPLELAEKMVNEQDVDPENWEEMRDALIKEMQRRYFNSETQRQVLKHVKDYMF